MIRKYSIMALVGYLCGTSYSLDQWQFWLCLVLASIAIVLRDSVIREEK